MLGLTRDSDSHHAQRGLLQSDREIRRIGNSLDTFFILSSGFLVFFMLCGFCLRCVGSVRKKNARSVVLVHFLAASVGALCFYVLGHGFAFGGGGHDFLGTGNFALHDIRPIGHSFWFLKYAYVATAAAIVSGAVAERMKIEAQLLSTLVLTVWVCPVVLRWITNPDSWLSPLNRDDGFLDVGMLDYARSSAVHLVGGVASFAGAAIVGRRVGRFDANGKPQDIPGHSATLSSLGVFILWFGWYGFNPGSTLTVRYGGDAFAARCAVTTTLSAAAACISTMTILLVRNFIRKGRLVWDVIGAGNGVLAGLVAISASCALVEPWAAIVIGIVAGLVYTGASYLVLNVFKLDDPVNAVSIHGFCGMWGLIAASAFADRDLCVEFGFSSSSQPGSYGFLLGGNGRYLASAIVGILAISGWVLLHMIPLFFILRALGRLRVSVNEEHEGLDSHCGISGDNQNTSAEGQTALTDTELVLIHDSTSKTQDDEIHLLQTKLEQLEARLSKLEAPNRRA